jgi:hypothetical protein
MYDTIEEKHNIKVGDKNVPIDTTSPTLHRNKVELTKFSPLINIVLTSFSRPALGIIVVTYASF